MNQIEISEILDKKLDDKFETLSESLSYQIEALTECKSTVDTIRYLLFLKEKNFQK